MTNFLQCRLMNGNDIFISLDSIYVFWDDYEANDPVDRFINIQLSNGLNYRAIFVVNELTPTSDRYPYGSGDTSSNYMNTPIINNSVHLNKYIKDLQSK